MADLNLKFENGKAPALNADNMNKIVNEINRTNAKTKDLQSEIATLVIEKGGSIVQANPEEVPTEKITSIRINEDVFEMASETGIEVTQAEYDAMEAAGEIEADVNYFVKDATTSSDSFAEEISNIKTSLNDFETQLIYKLSIVDKYSGNLNDLPAFSIAECLNSCTNLPFGALHSTVLTIRLAGNPNFAHQLCISGAVGHDRTANFIALRTKWSGSWGNWVTIK